MNREQTTIRLPAELKEQLQQEADIDYMAFFNCSSSLER